MNKVFIINAHPEGGRLNRSLVERTTAVLEGRGYEIRHTDMAGEYDVEAEVEKHQWADVVILQMPVHWMGVPWTFKRYMDEVYSAGTNGRLCLGDGRRRDPDGSYGGGGMLTDTRYMLSLTYNAPRKAFNDPQQYLMQGKSVDDMFLPMHLNFRFFGMTALETFVCHDVVKHPQIENDFNRLDVHLAEHFPLVDVPVP